MNTLVYQNYKVEIPADIAAMVRYRNRKRIVAFFIELCAVIAVLIYGWTIPNLEIKNYVAFGIIFLILPFVLTGVPFCLLDKSCCGEIVDIEIKTEVRIEKGTPKMGRPIYKNIVYAKIKLESGKVVRKKVYEELADTKGSRLETLLVGDVVVYVSGMIAVQRISDDERKDNFCVVCGALRPSKEEKCYNCGHTLSFKTVKEENDANLWWDSKADFHG